MKNVLRGLIVLVGMILIFMLITACAPNRSIIREKEADYSEQNFGDEDGISRYNYEEEDKGAGEFNVDRRIGRHKKRNFEKTGRLNKRSIETDRRDEFIDKDYNNDLDDIPSRDRFYQLGKASWYGREFHGKVTASGERFNMYKLTAAHRMLPFGTEILVRNLDNRREVRVAINDRGPYIEDRVLDLSYAAAKRLGMITKGQAMVGIKILRSRNDNRYSNKSTVDNDIEPVVGGARREEDYNEENRHFDESIYNRYSIQVGAFYSRRHAENLKRRLESLFDNPIMLARDNDLYKVRIEGITSKVEVIRHKRLLDEEGIPFFIHENKE